MDDWMHTLTDSIRVRIPYELFQKIFIPDRPNDLSKLTNYSHKNNHSTREV